MLSLHHPGPSPRATLVAIALSVAAALATPGAALAASTDALVVDEGRASVVRVDTSGGGQTLLSKEGHLKKPSGIVARADGTLFVSDSHALGKGAIVAIDATTGTQTVVAQLGYFYRPTGVAIAADGALLVSDEGGKVVRVEPATGAQTVIGADGLLVDPVGVAVGPGGVIYVADSKVDSVKGGLIRIDPTTGVQSQVASGAQFGSALRGIAVSPDGRVLVTTKESLWALSLANGSIAPVAAGSPLKDPAGVFAEAGTALVADPDAFGGSGGLISVDTVTGAQAGVSAGGLFYNPVGVTRAPQTTSPGLPGLPQPQLAAPDIYRELNVARVSGVVKVARRHGKRLGRLKPLTDATQVPVGSLIDVRRGRISLASATPAGGIQSGVFHGGRFIGQQRKNANGLVELRLAGQMPRCRAGRGVQASAKRRPRRRLWGNATGRYKTRGRRSAATVRGTRWLVEDRCAGTLTRVTSGVVKVRDIAKHKTVTVRAGQRYLARAKPAKRAR